MDTECSVCMENYDTEGDRCPKLLPCSHTVCLRCLRQLTRGRRVQCPVCRKAHQTPHADVANYPTNRYLLDNLQSAERMAHMRQAQMEISRRIEQLENEKVEVRRQVQQEITQMMAQLEAEKIEAERLIREEAEQRITQIQEDDEVLLEAWQKAHQWSSDRVAELENENDQLREVVIQRDYMDLEQGNGECFARFRTDMGECRNSNPILSAIGLFLLFILGLLEAVGIMAVGSVIVIVIIVLYILYTTCGIIVPTCSAIRDFFVGNTEGCYARYKNGIKENLSRSKDDIKGFFTRCKNVIDESYQCVGCHYILRIIYPAILYTVLGIICVVSVPCATVITFAGLVFSGIAFVSIVIVLSTLLSIGCVICASFVICIVIITVTFVIIVSSIYIIFSTMFYVFSASILFCFRNTDVASKQCTEISNCFENCRNGIHEFYTVYTESIGKCFGFQGCVNFLSVVNVGIIFFSVGTVSVIGVVAILAEGMTVAATVIGIAAIVLSVVIIAALVYAFCLCCSECCCR